MATKAILWIALFGATATLDWLGARWVDAKSRFLRAHYSALHELIGYLAGFATFTVYKDITLAIPCVLGAWVGSYFAGVDKALDAIDSDLAVACEACGQPFLAFTAGTTRCPACFVKGIQR